MTLLANSRWRCGCGAQQTTDATTYAVALHALRAHQADPSCSRHGPGPGDRIHSMAPIRPSEARKVPDDVPIVALHGPPRPPVARTRRAREGLPWLPGN